MEAISALNTIEGRIKYEGVDYPSEVACLKYLRAFIESHALKGKFKEGDRVRKKGNKGQWHGRVVGYYSTECTPIGYAVESERETNSVQIYPEHALELYEEDNDAQTTD